jgi:beta-alanine degradation protein BauB
MQRWIKAITFIAAVFTTSLVISQVEKKIEKIVQSQRFPQFDNADVKVWKTVIQPNQPLAMHHHDHPRVIVALTSGTLNSVSPSGAIEPHVWEAGKAYWLPAMPPKTLHADANAGTKPLEVMVIELQHEK